MLCRDKGDGRRERERGRETLDRDARDTYGDAG